jgi:hypothetical protein
MAEFKVPGLTLASPLYQDAMFRVFLHMSMMGMLITLNGFWRKILENNHLKLNTIFFVYSFLLRSVFKSP